MKTRRRRVYGTKRQISGMKCPTCDRNVRKVDDRGVCTACVKKEQKRVRDTPELEDIELFKRAGIDRGTNDIANNRRERVLESLYNPPEDYLKDPRWVEMSLKWRGFLTTLCNETYDEVLVERKGGRGYNYDMEIQYLKEKRPVCSVKAEFKHNSRSIDGLPEYFSPAANKEYFAVTYGDYFYDNFVDHVCTISEQARLLKPTKIEYVKHLYQNEYKKNPFFSCLYETEKTDTEFYKRKQEIVRESIKSYIQTYLPTINLKLISDDIRERQQGKVFILWDLENFRSDSIRDDEMELVSASEVKNNNTILAVSKAGTKHEMLLRWKNHLGVLYPAWQISLTR